MAKKLSGSDRSKLAAAEQVLRRLDDMPVRVVFDRTGACAVSVGEAKAFEAITLADAVDRALA